MVNDTTLTTVHSRLYQSTPLESNHEQVTPLEDNSAGEFCHDLTFKESSVPVKQLLNELPWSIKQNQVLQDSPTCTPKRCQTTKQARVPTNQNQRAPPVSEHQTTRNSQPLKCKRGRPPQLQPQPQTIQTREAARQAHLKKNRGAAHKSRQRKKEYIDSLATRAREFSTKNKLLEESVIMLREEVLELKNEVFCHAKCDFWPVNKYLARCAALGGMDAPSQTLSTVRGHERYI
ncbi:hypothetical protein K505DRAFT_359723 [Melanomma pulvis-pyrius CBS 109.77]|uniref:BZIP domain-containing protein n=1 Tax=Melanomma pulvis-pyrius CBS 109.77 TaxID=1314802 RepID=A0A6A6XHN3_9PLEO|nr:hypothetical protein K505DRAFT_359723 [Melanomma pulvis-pyrius CBS 109.77]